MIINLPNEEATKNLATKIARCLDNQGVLTFSGALGAGKTTFIRALLRSVGVTGSIKSPTFSLVESYYIQDLPIHHFDLYRIEDESELEYIGFREYFTENSICCIEWPERLNNNTINRDLCFSFSFTRKGQERSATLTAETILGEKILACLAAQ